MVANIDESLPVFQSLFGDNTSPHFEELESQDLKIAFLDASGLRIELLESQSKNSPISKFLKKRGPGIHHVAWKVKDIFEAFSLYKKAGFRLLSKKPYEGANNKLVFFVHPKDSSGVLIEFCAEKKQ